MECVDCVVIGAGVVGLACARRLAMAGLEVIVLERADAIGTETSSRNSEVIHAGVYYAKGSRKARHCIAGKQFLYRYCGARGIPHNRCGKLIVATDEAQRATLETIRANAAGLGMPDLEPWSADRAKALEPALRCTGALWSPTTGVIDSHGLMLAYQADAEAHGAVVALETTVESATADAGELILEVGGGAPMRLRAGRVINSAGLHAPALATRFKGRGGPPPPTPYLCKGNYYGLVGRSPFSRLIYPVPEQAGLGVHVTIDLAGRCRFGPDTEWVDEIGYAVDPARAEVFYAAVRSYWPDLADGALVPDYSGIRPKLGPAGTPGHDFQVIGPATHGLPGLVELFGIESPGLTASWPLACEVGRLLGLPELPDELA
ncbi:MAG: NAD(P)/FAD-dependent oxidoreductase [Geminicoccaceae bacterium]